MPVAVRNYAKSTNLVASATGLTALNQTTAPFTWSAWLRRYYANGGSYLWAHSDGGNPVGPVAAQNGMQIFSGSRGSIQLVIKDGSTSQTVDTPDGFLPFGAWTHIVCWYDGAMGHILRNGRIAFSKAATKVPTVAGTRVTAFGISAGLAGASMLHDLWDCRVFPGLAVPLQAATRLWDPTFNVDGCKQRLFYQQNWRAQGSGAVTIYDESGNGNHLTSSATTLDCDRIDAPDWRRLMLPRATLGKASVAPPDDSALLVALLSTD